MEEVWEVMEDISLEAAKLDISDQAAKQNISADAKLDISDEAAKQDNSLEEAKKDGGADAGVPLQEHFEAARKTKEENKLNLEDLVTGKKKSLFRKMHGYTKNVDEQV